MKKGVKFIPDIQRVLVLPDGLSEGRTASGIIIPQTAKEGKPEMGTVVVTGKGDIDIPMRYKEGDKVMFSNYAGIEVELNYDGIGLRTFKVMNQMDIMGKIQEVGNE